MGFTGGVSFVTGQLVDVFVCMGGRYDQEE